MERFAFCLVQILGEHTGAEQDEDALRGIQRWGFDERQALDDRLRIVDRELRLSSR